jgi:transposase-like protein
MKHNIHPQLIGVVALEALKGTLSTSQIAEKYGVESSLIEAWKEEVLEILRAGFETKPAQAPRPEHELRLTPPPYRPIAFSETASS